MVVDSSAIVAILRREDDAGELDRRIFAANRRSLSAVSYVEVCMVLAGSSDTSDLTRFDQMLHAIEIVIEPVTEVDAILARDAFLRYGKGRHPARLNFGDCFSYALAKRLGEPLLFKGDDFVLTDVLRS
jgi:ribonuclease VapC